MKAPELFHTTFERYTRVNILGEGANGIVFSVKDSQGQPFALKCLKFDSHSTSKAKRFKNELEFCSKAQHPNILAVVDSGFHLTDDGKKYPFFVMPIYPRTLRDAMRAFPDSNSRLEVFANILQGVEAAHLKLIVHRDLKPENILLEGEGHKCVIADFGIAHFAEQALATAVETRDSERLANFVYAAPEQKTIGHKVDHRADIFALGLILNELFTGQVIHGKGHEEISATDPSIGYLDPLVDHMIQQDASHRPGSIDEVKKLLISRRLEFVSRQRLDQERVRVIPRYEVDHPLTKTPIVINSADYRGDHLQLILNTAPDMRWIELYTSATFSHTSVLGSGPREAEFYGNRLSVKTPRNPPAGTIQQIVDNHKQYVKLVSAIYLGELQEEASRREAEERKELRESIKERERIARIQKDLRV
jgi:serine/threonine protein kinase